MRGTFSRAESGAMVSRRQVIFRAAVTVGVTALGSSAARSAIEEEVSHSAEAIHQETVFKASRKRVYEALVDAKRFKKVMQLGAAAKAGAPLDAMPTEISGEVGGAFTVFGGHIVGRQLELVPEERIVQAWRVVDWNPGIFSVAKFELIEEGAGTRIKFDHAGFPKGLGEHLAEGWKGNYWEALEKYFT